MGFLDEALGQLTGGGDVGGIVGNLAEKVGLPADQVQAAMAALAQAHQAPGDTVQTAAENTGLSQEVLQQILGHVGGEGGLGSIASHFLGGASSAA